MRLLLLSILALALTATGFSQDRRWAYVQGVTSNGTSLKITIYMPTGTGKVARGLMALAECPTAKCSAQTFLGGTVPTATEVALQRTRTEAPAIAGSKFFGPSDSTGGTGLPIQGLPIGISPPIDLSDVEARPGEMFSVLLTTATSQALSLNIKIEEFYDRTASFRRDENFRFEQVAALPRRRGWCFAV